MGLFEKIFKPKNKVDDEQVYQYFKTLDAYTPIFNSFEGGVYEMELTRAAIHCFATHVSKFKPEVRGSARKDLEKILQFKPNPEQDTKKFLYRLATNYMVKNNAYIIPKYDKHYTTIEGYYAINPLRVELKEQGNKMFYLFTFYTGEKAIMEAEHVGHMNQFQNKKDMFGEDNSVLRPTMELMNVNNQGIIEGIKGAANIRFLGKIGQVMKPKDINEERERLVKDNLGTSNNGGVFLIDAKYEDMKQINSQPFIVDAKQMEQIKENVFNYFGISENILQNKFTEDEYNSFYEGKLEPFALELGLVMTNMTFNERERAFNNQIFFSSNRLQYASNSTKLQVSQQLFDRGILTANQVMDIWNLPPVEDGDKRYIRREYVEVNKLDEGSDDNANSEGETI